MNASPRLTSIWDFANSNFGLFLMSSVVLGSLSFGYGQWRDYRTREQKSEQLDLEIALRLQAVDKMGHGPESRRYSNLVNVNDVINGNAKSSFYVRKPIFNQFQNSNLTTLLWQLYLLVPNTDRNQIKSAIKEVTLIVDESRDVRYSAANDLDDTLPKPKTKKQQDVQDDLDDIFNKEYGQTDIYRRIHSLAQYDRWKNLAF